ncbi:MAG: hypothetical protein ABJM26_18340 [Anderseniella sp.]
MAHINKVMLSINGHDDATCVDIFVRPDGTFGFEEYRRDVEDARGWFPVGHYSAQKFPTEPAALEAAKSKVIWLTEMIKSSSPD